ncbi:lipid-A-disaccharide synthase [uncultured Deefgea sp.]|uniref:lipid-A-disaccharide synthase n=1 Tax=uncultured Deefgea sp. TaxID=1304914 RepID=UPI00261324EA|nr:lipid-A-disaccharide synthase [uncultured Deefgea sp.]
MNDQLFTAAKGPRIAIVAGEASGDLLGAALIQALLHLFPTAQFSGVAGPKMLAAGAKTIEPMETLSVGGIVEVIRHLPNLLKLRRRLVRSIKNERPDLLITIDAPDFNIGLARKVKRCGIQTVHYVSPSVWAWRPERIKAIAKAVSHMLLILPFEKAIYQQANIPATYVGHPLADLMPLMDEQLKMREILNIGTTQKVLAVLPGSRQREVKVMAAIFVKTALRLSEMQTDMVFLVPFITRETRQIFESEIWLQNAQLLDWRLMFGHSHEAMIASDAILLASGTAALEAMLAKKPVVVAYKISPLTYKIVKRKFLLPYVSLPNIIAGRFIVPEFLQDEAEPDNLAQALNNYLLDKTLSSELAAVFTLQHQTLQCNAAARAAAAVALLLPKSVSAC